MLQTKCRKCGFEDPQGMRRCRGCGATLRRVQSWADKNRREKEAFVKQIVGDVLAGHSMVAPQTAADIDPEMIRALVQAEVKKHPPQANELTIKLAKGAAITVKHHHAALAQSLRRIDAGFDNLLLVGPAGSGKSTLAKQIAGCLPNSKGKIGRKFGFLSLSGGTTEGQLLGRLTSTGKYLPSLFVQMYEEGGVFLLDEVDAADANVLLVLNSALANGSLAVPARVDNPVAERHPDFILVCAANTWGTGADWQYVGRNQLDAAFLSRFAGAVLHVTYDEKLERALTVADWYDAFIKVRVAVDRAKVQRVMGTRELLAGQKLLKAGFSNTETWQALTEGWTRDEKAKAGVQC